MTPLLPGIVFQPLRFYDAAVTGRANSKKTWKHQGETGGSRGLELQHSRAPSSPLLTNQDTAPHTASQHALLFTDDTQKIWSRTEGERETEQEAERAEMQMPSAPSTKCPFHLKQPPFAGCKQAPTGWSPTITLQKKNMTACSWPHLTPPSLLATDPNSSSVSLFLSLINFHRSTTAGLKRLENGPKWSQGQGGTFNYCALTRLFSVCLSQEDTWLSSGVIKGQLTHLRAMENDGSQEPTSQHEEKQRRRGEKERKEVEKEVGKTGQDKCFCLR